ncbi:MAG: hypothetical protein VB875_00410, partial [Pirellulales bacterium]
DRLVRVFQRLGLQFRWGFPSLFGTPGIPFLQGRPHHKADQSEKYTDTYRTGDSVPLNKFVQESKKRAANRDNHNRHKRKTQ